MSIDVIVWLAAMIILAGIEALTVNLVTIWFAIGALAAFIAAVAGAQIWLQIVLFVIVTAVTLCFTRPLAKKYFTGTHQPTNADMVIGKVCVVTETIDNLASKGTVSCMGKEWSARSENGETVNEGTKVIVKEIKGVKLIVSPAEETCNL